MVDLDKIINYLDDKVEIPNDNLKKEYLIRALMNRWIPKDMPEEFFKLQDLYLQEKLKSKKITTIDELIEIDKNIYLWKGDITTLKVDAIVNAGNSKLLGCFIPHHKCI